jgi:hypothetical protein
LLFLKILEPLVIGIAAVVLDSIMRCTLLSDEVTFLLVVKVEEISLTVEFNTLMSGFCSDDSIASVDFDTNVDFDTGVDFDTDVDIGVDVKKGLVSCDSLEVTLDTNFEAVVLSVALLVLLV